MRGLLLVAVVGSIILGGCVGTGGATPAETGEAAPVASGPAGFDDQSGGVEGTVLDTENQPVDAATVALVEPNLQVLTDASGRFVFSNVPGGTYTLAAQKLGYSSAAKRIDVKVGEVSSAALVLEQIVLNSAYHTTFVTKGYFECSWTGASTGPCFFPIIGTNNSAVPVDPWANNKRQFDYGVGPGAMSVFNEMAWSQTSLATGNQMSIFLSYGKRTTAHNYCFKAGPNPVNLRWDRAADSTDDKTPGECNGTSSLPSAEPKTIPMEGQILTSRANTGPGATPGPGSVGVGVAFQQSFDLYVSAFYWEHAPEGFSGASDK